VTKSSLHTHRCHLAAIEPTPAELDRLQKTLACHLRDMGYSRVPKFIRKELLDLILRTQDNKPFFWIEANLPFCWNNPKDWDKTYIAYQWGHLNPRNSVPECSQTVTDLCLMSARCNNHIQSSLPLEDLEFYFQGSTVGARITNVIRKRRELFASEVWKKLLGRLERYREAGHTPTTPNSKSLLSLKASS
jgi:hypothetical protein